MSREPLSGTASWDGTDISYFSLAGLDKWRACSPSGNFDSKKTEIRVSQYRFQFTLLGLISLLLNDSRETTATPESNHLSKEQELDDVSAPPRTYTELKLWKTLSILDRLQASKKFALRLVETDKGI